MSDSKKIRIRVLVEQRAHAGSKYLASGEVYELDAIVAKGLLARGDAEPIAEKPAQRADKRPSAGKPETR